MNQEIYQKQFSVGRMLNEAWRLFTDNFQALVIITLIVYVPINIILYFVPTSDSPEDFQLYLQIMNILAALVGIIATMAIAYFIKNKIDGKTIDVKEAFKKSTSRWGAAVTTNIILGLFILGLTLLLIVPGIIYSIYWMFAAFVVILTDKSGKEALDYSKKIVKGRWWTALGYAIAFGLVALAVWIVGGALYTFLPENFLTVVIGDTISDIIGSFFIVVYTIFFLNFEATKQVTPPVKQ